MTAAPAQALLDGLSPAMKAQMVALRDHGAVSLQSALGPYDGRKCEPTLMARLARRGLVESKTLRAGASGSMGGQKTVHWLTSIGQTVAAGCSDQGRPS